eukprot:gb/GECG01007148.1/.p1 GENE.gb/GECG01007148.1/~~gb/GECG01007148.1/.p1  ORF type:complete len:258 (+),score=43.18 gb/GECG01007148.1/:1-774(+)
MRIKRQKEYRRTLRYYRINFDIKPPYKVLLDGNFIHQCVHVKLPLERQMKKVLDEASVELLVPEAVIRELQSLGDAAKETLRTAKTFKIVPDGERPAPPAGAHAAANSEEEQVDPHESIQFLVGRKNEDHYLVATQDFRLRTKLRNYGGIPTMYMNQNVIVLEAPSKGSLTKSTKEQESKSGATSQERELVKAITGEEERRRKKKRGPKGPNPLSMLPPKKQKTEQVTKEGKAKKNRRKTRKSSTSGTEGSSPAEPQ